MKKIILTTLSLAFLAVSCKNDDDSTSSTLDLSALSIDKVSSFVNGYGAEGYAEITAYDEITKQLFIVNPQNNEISVWDISNVESPVMKSPIQLPSTPNSVATYNGIVAVAIENSNKQANGQISLYNSETKQIVGTYPTGALPDMVTFSPNGKYIISANEGEPNDEYTIDPKGTITIIDTETNQNTLLDFTSFNNTTIGNNFRVFGPNATLDLDIEPEYIAVSEDSKFAYVSLQENNGMAKINLETKAITSLFGLGVKDHMLPENMMDASNKDDLVGNFKNWPVFGMYQPDAITSVIIDGVTYIISANEGDARDYDGFSEEERVKDITLDPTAFPNASNLQLQENLGRLKITTANGDVDNDGDFDELYSYGGRSFTIWTESGDVIYDSGDFIGRKTFELNPTVFNNDEGEVDGRSDDKGAEPEAVSTLKIRDKTLLFVGLERTGGVLVFNISTPQSPEFIDWILDESDVAPEGLITIPSNESPNGNDLMIVTNEVSNSISIYELK